MDVSQQEELTRWAGALEESDADDRRAAGRAIRLLCDANRALAGANGAEPPPLDRRELERWAKTLAAAETAELRAAGRAIRSLCAEHERLERGVATNGAAPVAPARPARKERRFRPRSFRLPVPPKWALAVVGVLVALAGGLALVARAAAPDLKASGPAENAVLGRAAVSKLAFTSTSAEAEWLLDGSPVQPVEDAGRHVYRPEGLADGSHELVIRQQGRFFASARRTFSFTVDTAPPKLAVTGPAVVGRNSPLVVRGKLEPGARLVAGKQAVPVAADGAFELRAEDPPRNLVLTATDAAGNASRWRVPVTVVPRRPAAPIRSVHVTAYAWADNTLREGVLALVRAKKINAVELDLKDESGEVGWPSGVPLAKQIGAQLEIYDLEQAIEQLHRLGVRVIGRLVCFRDPIHAQAAWKAGRRNEVVQSADGGPYSGYGGFTNFSNPAVQRYNTDLAVAAAKLGVDEILYDYVRRPDGPLSSMRFPGISGTPEQAIVAFLAGSRKALAGTNALLGASVFGVAATRPTEVAQDIPGMAQHVDYIAPMLYPSHWGPGEYGVADPNGQPYEIVLASTKDFVKQVNGTGARIVNWLQDFSYGRDYGPAEVQAQIKASRDAGVDDFILWDAAVDYTADALEPTAKVPALKVTATAPKNAPMPVRLPDASPGETKTEAAKPRTVKRPLPGLPPNELGRIPVVMHHMIRADRVGEYDQTPQEFRAELDYLWRNGYTPVNAGDLVAGKLDVPKGTTPVVLTFDDATTYQLDFTAQGKVKPSTAVGIMLEFARTHPGFVPAGTFYVNRTPFGSATAAKQALTWLTKNGFELGNHTHDHIPLRGLSDDEVRQAIATGAEVIEELLPGYKIRTFSLPLGSLPRNEGLAVRGSWQGQTYGPYAVLLVGANPAPSPFSKEFDPAAIPRIRSSQAGWQGEEDFAFSYWMNQLEQNPGSRYVSDGDPKTVTVPKGAEADVRSTFTARVRPAS